VYFFLSPQVIYFIALSFKFSKSCSPRTVTHPIIPP